MAGHILQSYTYLKFKRCGKLSTTLRHAAFCRKEYNYDCIAFRNGKKRSIHKGHIQANNILFLSLLYLVECLNV